MKKDTKRQIKEYAEAIITALILALIIRTFVIQAFKIPSGSMEMTLLIGDHILVNKFIYGTEIPFSDKKVLVFKNPERGDIIVFKYPINPKKDFIKRVIGIEGDVVESKDKIIYVNGQKLNDPYARHIDSTVYPRCPNPMLNIGNSCRRDNFGPITIPEGAVFVMGDNRDSSHDSRYWGFVDLKYIKGKALIIYWSWDRNNHRPRFKRIGRIVR